MISESKEMSAVLERVRRVASSELPVLISGETGTGKELIARAIHEARNERAPFVAINAGALPAQLIESELFGHVKGAFTGATADKAGLFEAASGGVLFLDEIGELPLELQPRLLRVLETGAVRRIGSAHETPVEVRIVAATHRDLLDGVERGLFREDLYHRLAILTIHLPPLRSRREDILPLAESFLPAGRTLSAEARSLLLAQDYSGNIRELKNIILRATIFSAAPEIQASELELPPKAAPVFELLAIKSSMTLEEERALLVAALRSCGNNRSRTARRLGISRSTLHEKLKRFQIPHRFTADELLAVG
jgi:two-component system response regulator HydG